MRKFSVPFKEDNRMIYAQEYLEDKGFVITRDTENADFVLLPIPAKKYMFEGLEDKIVFYGAGNFDGIDYNKNPSFLLSNAYLTAEGAVALCKESSDRAVFGSNVLITGYGRIAKALHRNLQAMGARVTVCSRSLQSKNESEYNGARHIEFEELKKPSDSDFIFNTVPHIVFTDKELSALKKDALLFDLASFPGGVDTLAADAKKIKLINGRALPSRYSQKTAGYLIGKAVYEIIREDLS